MPSHLSTWLAPSAQLTSVVHATIFNTKKNHMKSRSRTLYSLCLIMRIECRSMMIRVALVGTIWCDVVGATSWGLKGADSARPIIAPVLIRRDAFYRTINPFLVLTFAIKTWDCITVFKLLKRIATTSVQNDQRMVTMQWVSKTRFLIKRDAFYTTINPFLLLFLQSTIEITLMYSSYLNELLARVLKTINEWLQWVLKKLINSFCSLLM